jgi:serine/threonine-protein kinase SBK
MTNNFYANSFSTNKFNSSYLFTFIREICHRDVKLDNILVFRSDFSRVKLCDFGESRKVNSMVQRRNEWLPYTAPEIISLDTDETYK